MSSTTSPSALLGSPVGVFCVPSAETATTLGTGSPRPEKYVEISVGSNPPPSSTMPIAWPAAPPVGNW
jgi:hypothetical protein